MIIINTQDPPEPQNIFWEEKAQAINTKEDYEIVNGLMLGNKTYEEKETTAILKEVKILDML